MTPARLEMLWGRLRSAAGEQAATLVRTAFSSVVRDMHDYACAIFDARLRPSNGGPLTGRARQK